jgi:hypothetical protein
LKKRRRLKEIWTLVVSVSACLARECFDANLAQAFFSLFDFMQAPNRKLLGLAF